MFRRILLVFTDKELRLKLFKIIGLLIVARFLAHVPLPVLGIQDISSLIDNDAVFGLLNTISGGAYGHLSFVMLGIGPYITASIVMQLLGVIVPRLNQIRKEEGDLGQQKINRWTRMLTVPLAALNAWGILRYLASSPSGENILPPLFSQQNMTADSFWAWFSVIAAMAAGSVVMMWIGEIITEFKMGNGISLLILSGIVVRLPDQLIKYINALIPDFQTLFSKVTVNKLFNWDVWKALLWENSQWTNIRSFVIFAFAFFVTLMLVIFVNDAVRRIIIIYARRGHSEGNSRTLGKVKADLPIKVNVAGVIPIIFAVSFILFPSIVATFFSTATIPQIKETATAVQTYLSTQPTTDPLTGAGATLPATLKDKEFAGFVFTNDKDTLIEAKKYDPTQGQDLFGFTLSTFKVDCNYQSQDPANLNDQQKIDNQKSALYRDELKTTFFRGLPIKFDVPCINTSFMPEFGFHWSGVLAYTFFYFLLVIFFTYFYTSTIAFKTEEVAENLQKSGAYIPGYKPGKQTEDYLRYVSNRLNVFGSFFLALVALVPILLSQNLRFGDGTLGSIVGGTTILILVSVTIETLRQIEAQATAVDYERFTKY